MSDSTYALILAGGSGERFWPLSRRARPKQLLKLVSPQSLLEDTVDRLDQVVPPDHILVLTNVEQEAAVREILPRLPHENIVAEPAKRDTAAAVALGTAWVAARDHAATMIVLPADHVIKDTPAFRQTLNSAVAAATQTSGLITIGLKPTWACPGFGYIELGEEFQGDGVKLSQPIHRVVRFREKPNSDLAETFLRQGNFRWNAGMFVWTVPTVLSEFTRHAPELAQFISQLSAKGDFAEKLQSRFAALPKISFDYAIMEHADRVFMIDAGFDWDDVGGWGAIARYLESDPEGNAANGKVTALESSGNIVFDQEGKRIALLGVHDLIVVRTADAVLVCHRSQAEKIKGLVTKLPEELQ